MLGFLNALASSAPKILSKNLPVYFDSRDSSPPPHPQEVEEREQEAALFNTALYETERMKSDWWAGGVGAGGGLLALLSSSA